MFCEGLAVDFFADLSISEKSTPEVFSPTKHHGSPCPAQRGAAAVSGSIFSAPPWIATSLLKLKSVGAVPVISRAPRVKVKSWIAHWMKTKSRFWKVTRFITWMQAHTIQARSPER